MTWAAFVPLITALVTLAGGWLITTRVTDRWDRAKKRREIDFAAAQDFQQLYGEFFAVWKLWNARDRKPVQIPDGATWDLIKRATGIEGGIESLLAKICAERRLSESDLDALGALRQGFQQLRKSMQRGQDLPWSSSDVKEYAAFKDLGVYVSKLITERGSAGIRPPETTAIAAAAFRTVSDNRFEVEWVDRARSALSQGVSHLEIS